MRVKLQTENHLEFLSLKGGFTGPSKSALVKMPHCWKSHVTAQLFVNRLLTCLQRFANNTVADQPAHLRSLISAFVVRFLESFICKLATGEISIV